MEISVADFMRLSLNDVSDLLLDDIHENGKSESGALLVGTCEDG